MKRKGWLTKIQWAVTAAIVGFLIFAPSSNAKIPYKASGVVEERNEDEISKENVYVGVNEYRETLQLTDLAIDTRLETSSRVKADDMVRRNYWAHYVTDLQTDTFNLFISSGYNYKRAGENLAYGYDNIGSLIQAWQQSPTHDKILRGDYKDMGANVNCNYKFDNKNSCLIVLHLGYK